MNRHFHMICIRDKFSQNIGRQVPSKVIWDHLSTMYDMQALVSRSSPGRDSPDPGKDMWSLFPRLSPACSGQESEPVSGQRGSQCGAERRQPQQLSPASCRSHLLQHGWPAVQEL